MSQELAYITVLPMVYDRWGINDAQRVIKRVTDWCKVNCDRGTYAHWFSDDGRVVTVRAAFAQEQQLAAFKALFAPPED